MRAGRGSNGRGLAGLGSDGRGLADLGRGSRGLARLRSDAVGSPASGSLASGAVAASIFFYTRKKREEWMTGGLHMSGGLSSFNALQPNTG